jgi:Tat protein translocase TatB subunit
MNLGGQEILVIIFAALLLLGPDKLPQALRTLGRIMGEVKKYQDLAKREIEKAMESEDDEDDDELEKEPSFDEVQIPPEEEK